MNEVRPTVRSQLRQEGLGLGAIGVGRGGEREKEVEAGDKPFFPLSLSGATCTAVYSK